MTAWEVLGVPPDAPLPAIRQAYAARIRVYRPDTHPEEFSRIRMAYEQMKNLRAGGVTIPEPVPVPVPKPDDGREGPVLVPCVQRAASRLALPPPPRAAPPVTPDPMQLAEHQVGALFAIFKQSGERAGTEAFQSLLKTWNRHPIEFFLALEAAVIRGLAQQPELALVRLADRQFQWTVAGTARQSRGPGHRIICLIELTRLEDACLTGSWTQRALFRAVRLPLIGWGPERSVAIAAGQRWLLLCRQAATQELELRISRPVLDRLSGRQLWSTDLWWSALVVWMGYWSVNPIWEMPRAQPAMISLIAWWCGLTLACPLIRHLIHHSVSLRRMLPPPGAVAFPQRWRALVVLAGLAVAVLGSWAMLLIFVLRIGFSLFRSIAPKGVRAWPMAALGTLILFPVTLWLALRRLEDGRGAR